MKEHSAVKKRVVLTTAHDNQRSIQIDLYKSLLRSMADAQYIGSLVVEELKPQPKGVPSVELIIASNSKGILTADAVDLDASGGDGQHLTVSLTSLDEDGRGITIPDYEVENYRGPPEALYHKDHDHDHDQDQKRQFSLVLAAIGGCVVILIGIVLWLLLTQRLPWFQSAAGEPVAEQAPPIEQVSPIEQAPPAPPVAIEQAPPAPPAPPVEQAPPVAIKQAPPAPVAIKQAPPAPAPAPAAPVRSYRVPATIPREGVSYRVRWGDTLWDISEAFYRNPWLYTRIARFNGIRNPDRIIAGTTIRVPPKN
jgi:hypothetical protein